MDLQSRKLSVIEYLISLRDEKIFSLIESTILETKKNQALKRKLKPFTQKQILDRAELSNQNYLSGKVQTQEQLETESENW